MTTHWHPSSWQNHTVRQLPTYPSPQALKDSMDKLQQLPPLVTPYEIELLKQQLAKAAQGQSFLLQGGDCAESFSECTPSNITNKLKIILQMSLVLVHGLRKPLIRVGRIAGQLAKPRSEETESRDGVSLPSYRGDLVNGQPFTKEDRAPDPKRMEQGYQFASVTLNYIRALINSGFADLHHPENWDLSFMKHSSRQSEYQRIVDEIKNSIAFLSSVSGVSGESLKQIDFFTSHEALHLYYEQALTQQSEGTQQWYDLSCHFPWVGMRTAFDDSAHIEFLAGIANPVALKVGPNLPVDTLLRLIDKLNPHNEPGKLSLIHRFGARKVAEGLPPLVQRLRSEGKNVLFVCDPMHGNTVKTSDGIKTRHFDEILSELEQSFDIHKENGSHLGGVHFELTGENVTECIGGARGLTEQDLKQAYKSLVDPRLNYEQALEASLRIVRKHCPE